MLMLDIAVVNTALSAIAADLDTGLPGLQWVVDAYTLTLAATVITAGSLADRFGRRRLFGIGLTLFTATSLLCAGAQSITMLNVSRAAQGVGAAIMFAASLAVLSNAFGRIEQRIKALAAYGATMGGSFAVGPLVGGALTSGLNWRWIFLINLPLGLLCLSIVRRFVAESLDPRAARVDRPGLFTLTGGLFLLVFALLRGHEHGWASATILASFAGAAVLLCAFVAIEARVAQPMLPLRLFRNPSFTGAQVAAFGISASLFAMWLYMTLYLQQILGLSAIEAGLVYLPGTLVNFFVAGATASVGQRVSPRALVAVGLALIAAGQALLTIVGADSSWWLFLPGLLVAMVGTGMFNPAVSQVALSSAPAEQSGLAAGVNDMFRQAGIAVGVAALGALIPAGAAFGDGSTQSYVDGFHDALWVGAVVAAAAAAGAALLIRGPRRDAVAVAGDVAVEAA
jgi:EmrB/QacA subfamily drug resistance transporter